MPSFSRILDFLLAFTLMHPQPGDCWPNITCKVTPSSPDWPSQVDWKALNQSVLGHLTAPVLAGAVCHPYRPEFNNQSCTLLTQQWIDSSYHALQPASVDYNDDTCPPNPLLPCLPTGYPAYVIEATSEKDVQQGVIFAQKTGVRLIVKGTGHDVPSRSSGRGSLLIWTHKIRGIEIRHDAKHSGTLTAKIAAGMRDIDILQFAAKRNLTIVTGADPGVGVGGWTTGAGHGPLTSLYGLGADQVISMEVVTADGRFLEIDSNHYPDLFWAMRGGGGSTFAILISVTVRTYPQIGFSLVGFSYNTTASSETYWNLVTLFHCSIPRLSEAGAMGYYYATPYVGSEPSPEQQGQLRGVFLFPEKSIPQAQAILASFETAVNKSGWPEKVYQGTFAIYSPSFSADWQMNPSEPVGSDVRLGSRLLDEKALTSNLTALKDALRKSTPSPWTLIGHIIAGPGPRKVSIPGGSNAVLPAWRKAYTHIALPASWIPGNATSEKETLDDLRSVRTQALRDLAPDTGAYVNEGDPTEPAWQKTFYGENYARLLRIKKKWDPRGVFWCKPCVGNEEWSVSGGDAIGQHEGKICRK